MVGFEFLDTTSHTATESPLMMDSSPVHAGYNNRHCEKRPFLLPIVDIPFHE